MHLINVNSSLESATCSPYILQNAGLGNKKKTFSDGPESDHPRHADTRKLHQIDEGTYGSHLEYEYLAQLAMTASGAPFEGVSQVRWITEWLHARVRIPSRNPEVRQNEIMKVQKCVFFYKN